MQMTDDTLSVDLEDGRTISVPIGWYPRLAYATAAERNDWRIFGDTDGRDILFWEQLDEFIPVVALLTGAPSRESERSFVRWLASRTVVGDSR